MKKMIFLIVIFFSGFIYLVSCDDSGESGKKSSAHRYKIFITDKQFNGALVPASGTVITGIDGIDLADAYCMADTNKPDDDKTYKAMLADGTNRIACSHSNCSGGPSENFNWVLLPNTRYYRSDGETLIFTTNESGIVPVDGGCVEDVFENSFSDTGYNYWTGLLQGWTSSTDDCLNWHSSDGSDDGFAGSSSALNCNAISYQTYTCSVQTHPLVCVEQPE